MTINLEKKIAQFDLTKSPKLLDLTKKAATAVSKYGLDGKPARVAVALDISRSMEELYDNGQVQELLTRAAAIAVNFDDDGELDIFPFHHAGMSYGSLSPLEVTTAAKKIIQKYGYGTTNYGSVFEVIHDRYWPKAGKKLEPIVDDQPPVYIIFITDGATDDKPHAVRMIRQLSFRPCFVQAIALGQDYDSNKQAAASQAAAPVKKGFFGNLLGGGGGGGGNSAPRLQGHLQFLAELDDEVPNRNVDNFDFFGTEKPTSLSDVDFFDRMMGEYPSWLTNPAVFTMLGMTSAADPWS